MARCNIPRSVFLVAADTGTTFRNVGLNDDNSKSVALSSVDTTHVDSLKDLVSLYQKKLCVKDNRNTRRFRFKEIAAKEHRLRAIKPMEDAIENFSDNTVQANNNIVSNVTDNNITFNNQNITPNNDQQNEESGSYSESIDFGDANDVRFSNKVIDSPVNQEKGLFDKVAD